MTPVIRARRRGDSRITRIGDRQREEDENDDAQHDKAPRGSTRAIGPMLKPLS
jgi:hypothetical protein